MKAVKFRVFRQTIGRRFAKEIIFDAGLDLAVVLLRQRLSAGGGPKAPLVPLTSAILPRIFLRHATARGT